MDHILFWYTRDITSLSSIQIQLGLCWWERQQVERVWRVIYYSWPTPSMPVQCCYRTCRLRQPARTPTLASRHWARCHRCSLEEWASQNPCLHDIQSEGQREGAHMCSVWGVHRWQNGPPHSKMRRFRAENVGFSFLSGRTNPASGDSWPPFAHGNTWQGGLLPPEAMEVHTLPCRLCSQWSHRNSIRDSRETVPL